MVRICGLQHSVDVDGSATDARQRGSLSHRELDGSAVEQLARERVVRAEHEQSQAGGGQLSFHVEECAARRLNERQ